MDKVVKVRPRAAVQFDNGNDGRDARYEIEYRCSGCNKIIREGDIACDQCGTFHDWGKKARIKIIREVIWE